MNRRPLFTIAFLLIVSILRSTPYFYIKVETPSVWTAECALLNAQKEHVIYKIELQHATNDAHFTLDIEEPKWITLTYTDESLDIFVEPTDDLKMFFRGDQISKMVRFEGQGAENNTFFSIFQRRFLSNMPSDFQTKFLSPVVDNMTKSRILSSDATTFLSLTNADKETALKLLDAHESKIHKKLYSQLWKEINYTSDAQLYAYFLLKNRDVDEFRLTTQKFFPFRGFNYTDYERNETIVFRNALKTYIHYQAQLFQKDDDPNTLFETIEKKLDGYHRFWLEKEWLIEVLDRTNDLSFGRQHIELFREKCTFKELIEEIDGAYDKYLDVTERSEAPDLQLVTLDNTPVNLNEFLGKVVYINFWASWCSPCINNFMKYAMVRNHLYTEGVVLLNISIDEQHEQFRNAVSMLNLKGLNVQPMDIAATKRLYNLYAIPNYFIVDKQGKFAHLSDKEGRDVLAEFKKLLAE